MLGTDRDWLIDIVKFVAGRPVDAGRERPATACVTRAARTSTAVARRAREEHLVSFASPLRLLLIVVPLVLLVAYLLVQRSRRKYALRFTSVDLLASVAPRRPGGNATSRPR